MLGEEDSGCIRGLADWYQEHLERGLKKNRVRLKNKKHDGSECRNIPLTFFDWLTGMSAVEEL